MPPVDPKTLVPTHLQTTTDIKEVSAAALAAAQVPPTAADPRLLEETYTFHFKWTSPTGKTYEGTFVNRIPDLRTQNAIAVTQSQLLGGLSWDSFAPVQQQRAYMLAHMTWTLDEKGRPDWAKDLQAIRDPQLLRALWEEVARHEDTFLGGASA